MTPSLIQLADTFRDLGDFSPTLDGARCLNARHQKAGQCTACQDACPLEAIQSQPIPAIDSNRCLGCNACAAACPTSALQGRSSPLEAWRQAVAKARGEAVSFVCRAAHAGLSAAVPIPCVSAVPAEFFIALSIAGIRHITLYTADCLACPLDASLDQAREAIQVAQAFLKPLDLHLELEQQLGSPPPAEVRSVGVSRRQFLRGLVSPTAPPAPHYDDHLDDLLAYGYGWRRALLLEALRYLGEIPDVSLSARPGYWAGLAVNSACIGCGMCAQFCPTEALSLAESDDGQVVLRFDASRCTACGLCQRVCFKGAINDGASVELRTLASPGTAILWQGMPSGNPLNKRLKKTLSHA